MTSRLALVLSAAVMSASQAVADATPRCALLGQMAGSVWLEMIQALGDQKNDRVDGSILRLDALTNSYVRMGCDSEALNTAFDCVLDDTSDLAPKEVLRACLVTSDIAQD